MAGLTPVIGSSGIWKLKPPFDNKLLPNLAYKCEAVNSLTAVISSGFDALTEYYINQGLDQVTFDKDVKDNVTIVTLLSSDGNVLFVPQPYIDGLPSSDVVPYVVMGMVIQLGALPNTIDPAFLTPKVTNAIKNALGLTPIVEYVTLSEVTNILFTEHEALEVARKANITDDNTDFVRRLKAETDLAKANATIQVLQQFILDSGIPIPIVPGP